MRSLALTALLGSFIVTTSLVGQSLTEHAAAAAGATIGTAAGKPLGTALGNIFGSVDKNTSKAANPKAATTKTANPSVSKPTPAPEAAAPTATVVLAPSGDGSPDAGAGGGGGGGGSSRHSARRRESVEAEPVATPILPIPVPEPVVKEPTAQDVASVKVGATASEVREALGAPESKVSIPGDDGHMLETCQYWAKGEQIGTIRLDNGRVVSVQTN
jgi:hypothetical protein